MKKLTLDETWEQCLAMWKWISRRCLGKSKKWCRSNIESLKKTWLREHGIKSITVAGSCFFCEKAHQVTMANCEGWYYPHCGRCPAKKVDSSFDCTKRLYNYQQEPRKFYAKLKELNKIRLETK